MHPNIYTFKFFLISAYHCTCDGNLLYFTKYEFYYVKTVKYVQEAEKLVMIRFRNLIGLSVDKDRYSAVALIGCQKFTTNKNCEYEQNLKLYNCNMICSCIIILITV